jgi:DNA end-binding protein Ku
MPSAIWTGSIGFGLVQVPVRLVTATRSKDVSFNQLEAGTGARIRYKKISEKTGDEVTQDKIQRGYEVSKGRYVIVEDEEIETLRPKGSRAIEIEEFVDLEEIDPIYFEQPYYLAPDKRGMKPYKLLVDAMTEMNKVAIGRITRSRSVASCCAARSGSSPSARSTASCASKRCVTPTKSCHATRSSVMSKTTSS